MELEDILLEDAKDSNLTCKVKVQGKIKYLYSKYDPKRVSININEYKDYILIFGLGLGYELEYIEKSTNKPIFVIDESDIFYNIILESEKLKNIVLNSRAKFLFGYEYKTLTQINMINTHIINNKNLTSINERFFMEAIQFFYKAENCFKNRIVFFSHPTIEKDCIDALTQLGYDVKTSRYVPDLNKEQIISIINEYLPEYVFTINFYSLLADICELLNIKYISWTVDTPNFNLYYKQAFYNKVFLFIYDESIVQYLKEKGVSHVYYLPVAANIKRLNNILIDDVDKNKYKSDVTFLGNTGIENEFNFISKYMEQNIIKDIYELFNLQISRNDFVIKQKLNKNLVDEILKYMPRGSINNLNNMDLLEDKDYVAFLLAKKYNEIERINFIKAISSKFNTSVYGDKTWELISSKLLKYKGNAEHYLEMPKIFKISKINLNITRVYVESGLPMRVFDVMGSGGFLVTNYKKDIERYFINGKDLVIYRDFKDLMEICEYYLEHEKQRKEILYTGYEKIKKEHTYELRMKEIMNILNAFN